MAEHITIEGFEEFRGEFKRLAYDARLIRIILESLLPQGDGKTISNVTEQLRTSEQKLDAAVASNSSQIPKGEQ